MKNFLDVKNPWDICLEQLCADMKVRIPGVLTSQTYTEDLGSHFLGCGGFGRVYKVINEENINYALKIVISMDIYEFSSEYNSLVETQSIPHVIPLVLDSYKYGKKEIYNKEFNYAGYLMKIIGTPITKNIQNIRKLLESLNLLHKANVSHGDARINNAIFDNEQIYWIDFRMLWTSCAKRAAAIKALLQSVNIEISDEELMKYDVNYKNDTIINEMFINLRNHLK